MQKELVIPEELKGKQREIFEDLVPKLKGGFLEKPFMCRLVGSAGTGKTYLVSKIIEAVRGRSIYVTAPTHSALKVLSSKISEYPGIEFKTIHSALSLKRKINSYNGKVTYTPEATYKKNKRESFCSIMFIDESSMLGVDLIKYIEEVSDLCSIVFLGDNKQINPVGEDYSPVFQLDCKEYKLEEIIRQGKGNPIIQLANNMDLLHTGQDNLTESGDGYTFSKTEDEILEILANREDETAARYICWTNEIANKINGLVRQKKFGNHPPMVCEGESLIFDAPYGSFNNGDILTITDIKTEVFNLPVPIEGAYYRVKTKDFSSFDTIQVETFLLNDEVRILHSNSMMLFYNVLKDLEIKTAQKLGNYRWDTYYAFKENFLASMNYTYANTIHKSQGSTYHTAIINFGDIYRNRKQVERDRILYTAVTRASNLNILTR